MTTALAPATLTPTVIRWTEVEKGFHVAYRGESFAGFVETTRDGSFVAFDEFSSPIGRYRDLSDAQRSLRSTVSPANERRRVRFRRIRRHVAVVTGGVAGALLLTAGVLAPYL